MVRNKAGEADEEINSHVTFFRRLPAKTIAKAKSLYLLEDSRGNACSMKVFFLVLFCFLIRTGLVWKCQPNEMSVVIYDFHFDQLLTFWVICTLTRKALSARFGELVTQLKSKGETY